MGTAGAYKFAEDLIREPTLFSTATFLPISISKPSSASTTNEKRRRRSCLRPLRIHKAMVGRNGKGRTHPPLSRKAKADEITCNTINAGTYVLEPKVLDYLPAGENYSFEYGLFPDLLKRGERFMRTYPARTYWIDIGTPERYLQVHSDLLANRVRRIHIRNVAGSLMLRQWRRSMNCR